MVTFDTNIVPLFKSSKYLFDKYDLHELYMSLTFPLSAKVRQRTFQFRDAKLEFKEKYKKLKNEKTVNKSELILQLSQLIKIA